MTSNLRRRTSRDGWTGGGGEKQRNNKRCRLWGTKKVLQVIRGNLVIQSVWSVFRIFCNETNLHGMKHIFGTKSAYNRWQ